MVQNVNLSNPQTPALVSQQEIPFAVKIVQASWWLLGLTAIIQCVFFWSVENVVCMGAVGIGWAIVTRIFVRQSMLSRFPFSSLIIIGFSSSTLYFPLVFTTMEGKPMVFNLELPEQVFFHAFAALLTLVSAHAVYRFLWRISYTRSSSLLEKIGFFETPTNIQIWLMGVVGMTAQWYVFFKFPDVAQGVTGEASDKFIQALIPFTYAPFFIPVGKLYGNLQPPSKKFYALLLAYTIVLFALSMGRSSRGSFMFGFTGIAFTYALGLLLGVFKTKLFSLRNGIFAGLLFWLLTGPMAELGTAMVIVREHVTTVSASELIDLTLEAYGDKEAIRERRLEDKTEGSINDWDEPYLDNIFAARFANVKFSDMTLIQHEKLGDYDPDMISYSIDYILCALPGPFMNALNIDADKEAIYSISFGDYIYLLGGGTGYYSGYRTGHFAGTGLTAFGWWYLALLAVGMLPIFFLFDKFFKRRKISKIATAPAVVPLQFSLCGLIVITSIWHFLPNESVAVLGTFLIRGWIQLALLYIGLFYLTRIVSLPFTRRKHSLLPTLPTS